MESQTGLWLDPTTPLPQQAPAMEPQGRVEDSSQDGSLPSCSSTSSEQNHSTGMHDVTAMLKDDDVRAMLKKVTVNEGVLNMAIQILGGGEKGLNSLMGYILLWVKHQRESTASQNQQPHASSPPLKFPISGSAGDDAFQLLDGILQPQQLPSTLPAAEPQHFQRFKSRRLMMAEQEMDARLGGVGTGFCPSSFMSVAPAPEDFSGHKSELVSPGIMAPCVPPQQLNYVQGMQPQPQSLPLPHPQPQPQLQQLQHLQQGQPLGGMQPFTNAHMVMPSVEVTPAMTTKAARRHRMARQRQSMMNHHARAAGHANPGSWNAAPAVNVKQSGASYARGPQSAPAISARKGRNMESLTLLLQKELRPSDVGNLGRIILPKKEAEQHLPFLAMRGGVSLQMEDFDSGHTWNLRYSVTPLPKMGSSPLVTSGSSSFWPNNKSRMYLLENTGEFVKLHSLAEGDLLVIYRSQQGGYVLRGKKKKTQRLEVESVQTKYAHSSAKRFLPPEEPTSLPKESGSTLVQRLYGGAAPELKYVKEEPTLIHDDDPFLKDMMLSMGPSFESDNSCLQTLERFPSLNLDFPLDEIMAVTTTMTPTPTPTPTPTTKAEPEG